jgi:hypothetical protein
MAAILVITDSEGVGACARHVLRSAFAGTHTVRALAASECPTWLPRAASAADLFVLELLWRFEAGYHAQGLALARRQSAAGKRVLLFSCLAIAPRLDSRIYWDIAAADRLIERVSRVLAEAPATTAELDALAASTPGWQVLPSQHPVR